MRGASLSILAAALALAACQNSNQMLAERQPTAIAAVVEKAKTDFDCQDVSGEVTSSMMRVPPPRALGQPSLDYMVQASGCGKSTQYVAVCPAEGTACFAEADPGGGPLGP
jgi:hypothetical protein